MVYTLNKNLEIFGFLDEKHLAILETLSKNEGEWFGFLLEKTNKKIPISQRPFGRRLKDLQNWGYATKRGWSYYFATSQFKKSNFSKLNLQFNKLRKKVDKVLQFSVSPARHTNLVKEIFDGWYVPLSYQKLCFTPLISRGEEYKINNLLERCEKLMLKLTKKLEKIYPGILPLLAHYEELIFIEKVKK